MKSKKLEKFQNDWNAIELIKCFEFEVINKQTSERDWICFDIELKGSTFYATHISLNKKQAKSKKISFVKHVCDIDFSIDMNLNELLDTCLCALLDSDFYTLID
jgi:hypothetical protein